MRKTVAALLLSICSFAHALTIDFDGLAVGSSPGDAYAAQGVRFLGGIIASNTYGNYLTGAVRMTVDSAVSGRGISVLADSRDGDTPSLVCGSFCESMWIPTTHVPSGVPANHIRWGEGTLFGAVVRNSYDGITSINFNTIALDNIWFDSVVRQPDRIIPFGGFGSGNAVASGSVPDTAEVPEPSTILILGLGLVFLYGRHRQDYHKVVQQRA